MLIGYARVSTEEQTLTLQIDALRKAGCERLFEDHGVSGKDTKRPGLSACLRALKAGDTLVVWRLDRLGRSLAHLIKTIQLFDERGIHFKSLTENIDTSSSAGRLVFHIMGAMAEFERNLISERTRAGMAAAKARGISVGRPPVLSDEQRQKIAQQWKQGRTATELANRFRVSEKTIRNIAAIARRQGSTSTGGLPRSTFSSNSFDQWHDAVSVLYVPSLRREDADDFNVQVDSFMLGDTSLASCTSIGQAFSRTESQIGHDGLDNYMIQIFREGGCRASTPGGDIVMKPGDVCVFDSTRQLDSYNPAFNMLAFTVPRHRLAPLLHDPDGSHLSCVGIADGLAGLFRNRLEAAHRSAASMQISAARTVESELIDLLAAAINGGRDTTKDQKLAIERAQFGEAQRYIDANLGRADLTAQNLALELQIPRSLLSRLFKTHGGLAAYIRQRRLMFVRDHIVNPSNRRVDMAKLAVATGFNSLRHMARAFEARYGVSPAGLKCDRSSRRKSVSAANELSWSQWIAGERSIAAQLLAG